METARLPSAQAARVPVQKTPEPAAGIRFYDTLLHALSELGEGVVVMEGEWFVYVNEAFARMVGRTTQELAGGRFSVRRLYHPDARDQMEERLRQRLSGEQEEDHYEGILQHTHGAKVFVEISVKPLRHDERVLRFAVIRDITRRKRAEDELSKARLAVQHSEKLAALGSLVSGVAHEIRTPLAYASNHVYLLRSYLDAAKGADPSLAPFAARVEEHVAFIDEGIDRAARLVGDLRKHAGVPNGDYRDEPLNEAVADAIRIWEGTHRGSSVTLETRLEPTPPIRLDRARFHQVVLNLLQNAADAMPQGGRILLSTEALPQGACLRVRDEGDGIPPDLMGRLFEPFHTTKEGGLGLGLHIVRRIVEQHRGTIRVETSPGAGTTFVVTFELR